MNRAGGEPGHLLDSLASDGTATQPLLNHSEVIARFRHIDVLRDGRYRPSAKPLIALMAIARCVTGKPRLTVFQEI